jgi:ABC-type Zn uptake system ZnuABC Zn-binding protein ZnuA
MANGLAAHLPQHEAAIRDNCEAYVARLNALDAELKGRVRQTVAEFCRDKTLILVSHHGEDGDVLTKRTIFL